MPTLTGDIIDSLTARPFLLGVTINIICFLGGHRDFLVAKKPLERADRLSSVSEELQG